ITQLLGIFSFLVVLLRAAILCFQSVAIGGVLFLTIVAREGAERGEELLRPSRKLIRWSALALALSQLFFVSANSGVLRYSADVSLSEVLGANYVLAGLLAIVAGLWLARGAPRLGKNVTPFALLPAGLMLAAAVMTSHSASRMENRGILVAVTALHLLTTASWIGGLPYLLLAMKRLPDASAKAVISRR